MDKKSVFGVSFANGKMHVGNLANIPEVQTMVGKFRARAEERANVVMVRLSHDALARVDQLVDSTLAGSRSEAAAILVGAGIDSQKELFERLTCYTDEIKRLKEQLKQVAFDTLKPSDPTAAS